MPEDKERKEIIEKQDNNRRESPHKGGRSIPCHEEKMTRPEPWPDPPTEDKKEE